MSSIGPSSRVPRLDPPKSGEGRRQPDDTREGGGDTLSDSGGGRQFGGYGGDSGQRTGGRGGDLASSRGDGDAHGGEAGASPDLARRADDFQRSLKAAMADTPAAAGAGAEPRAATEPGGDGLSAFAGLFAPAERRGEAEDQRESDEPAALEQVLAASTAAASTLPLLTALQPVSDQVATPSAASLVHTVEERVTQAIRAEMAGQSAATATVSIDLAGLVEGLSAVTIRLSATGLDVVFSGSLDLGGEAQALADRLSRRFGNRSVRVLAAAHDGEGRAQGGAADEDGQSAVLPVGRRTGDPA